MAGHSKWANIKHRKADQDARRGKIFTKLIREITVAARLGGGHVADNPRLRAAVDKALANNMPKDTIDRAIDRGSGNAEGQNLDELVYEGYAPNGVAVLVEAMTDNKNRTVADVRHGFSKHGGKLGTSGSVAYLFERKGYVVLPPGTEEEPVLEVLLDSGAEDVTRLGDDSLEITTSLEELGPVKDLLSEAGYDPSNSEMTMVPSSEVDLDLEQAQKLMRLIEHLEDLDDVQNVYSNANFSDEVMNQL